MLLAKEWINISMNKVECPEIDPHAHSELVFDKGTKAIQWPKIVFVTNDARTAGHLPANKKNLDTDLTPFTKISPGWIIDLHIKCKAIIPQRIARQKFR